jgi:hypothetical protein
MDNSLATPRGMIIGIYEYKFNFSIPSALWYGFSFRVGSDGTEANPGTELAIIRGSGNFQISGATATKLSGTSWATSSDKRLKENIEDANIDLCYENFLKLPLKRFTLKREFFSDDQIKDRNLLGFIADDVELLYPKSVHKVEQFGLSDCKQIEIDEIMKTHYGATQKLIKKVEVLETENTQLKQMLETLMTKFNVLETEINNLKK